MIVMALVLLFGAFKQVKPVQGFGGLMLAPLLIGALIGRPDRVALDRTSGTPMPGSRSVRALTRDSDALDRPQQPRAGVSTDSDSNTRRTEWRLQAPVETLPDTGGRQPEEMATAAND